MNVLQFLIDNARKEASARRATAQYATVPGDDYRMAKELDAAADLAEHSLRALGLLASGPRIDEE